MKKFKPFFPMLTLALFVLAPFFQSCLDDNNDDRSYLAIATFRTAEHGEIYFVLDEGEKMYANNKNLTNLEDGQRVYIYFDLLDEKISGYDYYIRIRDIQEILTKNPFVMTEETADSIGDDKINITNMWFGDGYLNVQFQFLGTRNSSTRHMINLVYNETEGADANAEDGYISMEFRHNAYDNQPAEILNGIVSFKGPFAKEGMKGLKIRYNSIYENVKYRKIEFSNNSTANISVSDNASHALIR